MAKLYQKQGVQLPRKEIIQPEKQPSIAAAVANFGANALAHVAQTNFVLGHTKLVNSIIDTAYEKNPTNQQAFDEMVQAGIAKSTRNLPGDMARKIQLDTETKADGYRKIIKNNFTKAQNAELKANVMANVDDIVGDGPMGLKSLNMLMMDAFINKDEAQAASIRSLWERQRQKLSNLAEVKDSTGGYVIGEESERNMYKQGLYGKTEAFRGAIENLSKDALIAFDKDIFQDKAKFMQAYGVDYTTYDEMERLIKARRKAFDSSDKREIKKQDHFALSRLSFISDEQLNDIKERGTMSDETIKAITLAKKYAKKAGASESSTFNFGDQDTSFLAGITELQNVISTDDGSPEYADKLLQAGAKVDITISKMKMAGLGDEQAEILHRALENMISSQDCADILNTDDDSVISEIARGAKNDYDTKTQRLEKEIRAKYPNAATSVAEQQQLARELSRLPTQADYRGRDITGRRVEISDNAKQALKKAAAAYWAQIIALENAGRHDEALNFRQQANQELIYLKYSDYVSRREFDRMEKELKAGKKAYIMIGNSTFEYKGLTQNGIILKGEF